MASATSPNPTSETFAFSTSIYASVNKFSTGTFNDWNLRLYPILAAQRLVIHFSVPAPTEPDKLDEHETKKARALVFIHATIDPENFEVIQHVTSPWDAYVKLRTHHDNAGAWYKFILLSDLVTLRLSSDGDLNNHLHTFRKLPNKLLRNLSATPDIKISEALVEIIVINSLPPDNSTLVQSLLPNFGPLSLNHLYVLLQIQAPQKAGLVDLENCFIRKLTFPLSPR